MHSSKALLRFVVGISVVFAVVIVARFGVVTQAETSNQPFAVNISATKVDSLFDDVDTDSVADPGDTLLYTVTINNSGTTDATGVNFTDTVDPNTTLMGDVSASAVAVNDTLPVTVVGNVSVNSATLSTPFSVTANDFLGQNPTSTIDTVQAVSTISSGTITAASAQGGTVVMTVATGQFTYNPLAMRVPIHLRTGSAITRVRQVPLLTAPLPLRSTSAEWSGLSIIIMRRHARLRDADGYRIPSQR